MKRLFVVSLLAFALVLCASSQLGAQLTASPQALGAVPGRNTNMVSGTGLPGGDPYLQRQNEPSMAVSTRNPQHLLAGANDYRTVDIPFPPDTSGGVEKETGDAWVGVFTSIDGGKTWLSTLVPGYPQDQTTTGKNSPLFGFAAATDPTVRAGTNGLFYYSGLVFNRLNNSPSGVFVATFQDQNNKGNGGCSKDSKDCSGGNVWKGKYTPAIQDQADKSQNGNTTPSGNPFLYRYATLVDTGNSGEFLDKPWIAVDVPRGAAVPNCTDASGTPFTSGNAYVFYTSFNGSTKNPSSAINVVTSKDCGATWSKPVKISQSAQLNQGTVAAVDPTSGTVYVFWRQIGGGTQNQPDSILYASSTDGGGTWTTATAYAFPSSSTFDENANDGATFREEDLPAVAVDGGGRVWLAFSQRIPNANTYNTSKIVITTLAPGGKQKNWTTPFLADPLASTVPGHQLMPAFAFAYGRLMLIWYDTRDDHTKFVSKCPTGATCVINSDGELRAVLTGGKDGKTADLWYSPTQPSVFGQTISDAGLNVRHTIDVRGTLVDPSQLFNSTNPNPTFLGPTTRISQYALGSRCSVQPLQPGQHCPDTASKVIEQMKFNPPNFPMFSKGKKPFMGDYIDVAALSMLAVTTLVNNTPVTTWMFNTQPSNAAVFHATWTDNRDVRPPPVINGVQDWQNYTPVGSQGGTTKSNYDSSQTIPQCDPARTGDRDQNVYTADVTEGLLVGFKENSKNLNLTGKDSNGNPIALPRVFSVFARNTTNQTAFYRMTINPPPANTIASFSEFSQVSSLDVTILPRTTISRSVFVSSSMKNASISVLVAQITGIPNGTVVPLGLQSTATTNPDITNPDITNPDITNPDITNPDITNPYATNPDINNAEVYDPTVTNPDITNLDITNPDITNPDITNPDITNPDITNPDINNLQVTNPDITNPVVTNPDITNPDITNPDITNPDITNISDGATDFSFKLANRGNTSSSYGAQQFSKKAGVTCCPAGCSTSGGDGKTCPVSCNKCQLIARKAYSTPVANSCTLAVESQNIPISSIPNPAFTTDGGVGSTDPNTSDATNSTVSLGPSEGARVTLRVFGTTITQLPSNTIKTVAVAGGADTGQTTQSASLAITTTNVRVAVVGTNYSTTLMSVGGVPINNVITTSWSETGALPQQITLAASGLLSGPVIDTAGPGGTCASCGAYPITAKVNDSTTPPNVDFQDLTIDVNKLSITSITATTSNSNPAFVNPKDTVTVAITVSNQGPAQASNVKITNFPALLLGTAGGTPPGPAPTLICTTPIPQVTPPSPDGKASISGNSSVQFIATCNGATGNGTVTFSAGASGEYDNSAGSSPASVPVFTGQSLTVDTTPPTLTLVSVMSNNLPYQTGAWTNKPVTLVYACSDNLSGLMSQPVISVLNANSSTSLQTPDLLHSTATVTLTAPPDFANGSVAAACQDQAGNVAASPTPNPVMPIMIDTTTPTIPTVTAVAGTGNTAVPYMAGSWTNQNVTVTFKCMDNLSGPAALNPVISGLPAGVTPVFTNDPMTLTATASATLTAETPNTTLTAVCTDNATNVGPLVNGVMTPAKFGPIMIDRTAPQLAVAASTPNGPYQKSTWTNQSVTVVFTCTDTFSQVANSGVISPTYPALAGVPPGAQVSTTQISPTSASTTVVLTAETAGTTLAATCSDVATNPATGLQFGPIMIDNTAVPVIAFAIPTQSPPGPPQQFLLNQKVTPMFTCMEGVGGIDQVSSCVSTAIDTSKVGSGTLTVNAADQAGNASSATTNYLVVYNFSGFQAPLQPAGPLSTPSDSGSFTVGTTIPIAGTLQDAGHNPVADATAVTSIVAYPNASCSGPASGAGTILYNSTTGTAAFSYDTTKGRFLFNWNTTSMTAGCDNLVVTTKDTLQWSTIVHLN